MQSVERSHSANPPPELRASDAERERTVEALRAHAAEGRLDVHELEQRMEAALGSRTHAQLERLTADLPGPEAPRRAPGPGLRSQGRAFVAVMAVLVGIWALAGAGYFWPLWPLLGWGLPLLMGKRRVAPGWRRHGVADLRRGSLTVR